MDFHDTALYRAYRRDDGWDTGYEDFGLTGVLVRERRSADPERPEDGVTHLWFFPGRSVCTGSSGSEAPFPTYRPGGGGADPARGGRRQRSRVPGGRRGACAADAEVRR